MSRDPRFINPDIEDLLLTFQQSGYIQVTESNVFDLLQGACVHFLPFLIGLCENFLISKLVVSTAEELCTLGMDIPIVEIESMCKAYVWELSFQIWLSTNQP